MAMAVAVKSTPETARQQALKRLAVGSLVGTLYVLGCLAIIYSIPVAWGEVISPALVGAAGALVDAAVGVLVTLGWWPARWLFVGVVSSAYSCKWRIKAGSAPPLTNVRKGNGFAAARSWVS